MCLYLTPVNREEDSVQTAATNPVYICRFLIRELYSQHHPWSSAPRKTYDRKKEESGRTVAAPHGPQYRRALDRDRTGGIGDAGGAQRAALLGACGSASRPWTPTCMTSQRALNWRARHWHTGCRAQAPVTALPGVGWTNRMHSDLAPHGATRAAGRRVYACAISVRIFRPGARRWGGERPFLSRPPRPMARR
jgi:hypothetical protein